MNDYDALMLLKSKTENLLDIIRQEFLLISKSHDHVFAANCVLGSCISAIAIVLNVEKYEGQDEVLSGICEQITKETKKIRESGYVFVDKEGKI
jgi:hypothetical protein